MTTPEAVDRRRADLTAEIDGLAASIDHDSQHLVCLRAELQGHDGAVALVRAHLAEPAITAPKRRNIAAEVYKVINAEPQTVSEIAREIGNVKLSAIDHAIRWHIEKGNVCPSVPLNGQARYVRASAPLQEAAE